VAIDEGNEQQLPAACAEPVGFLADVLDVILNKGLVADAYSATAARRRRRRA
jgi:hypothetical protein